jgi:hypothetical protein
MEDAKGLLAVSGLNEWEDGVDERETAAESSSVESGVEYVPVASFTRPFKRNAEILDGQRSGSATL